MHIELPNLSPTTIGTVLREVDMRFMSDVNNRPDIKYIGWAQHGGRIHVFLPEKCEGTFCKGTYLQGANPITLPDHPRIVEQLKNRKHYRYFGYFPDECGVHEESGLVVCNTCYSKLEREHEVTAEEHLDELRSEGADFSHLLETQGVEKAYETVNLKVVPPEDLILKAVRELEGVDQLLRLALNQLLDPEKPDGLNFTAKLTTLGKTVNDYREVIDEARQVLDLEASILVSRRERNQ